MNSMLREQAVKSQRRIARPARQRTATPPRPQAVARATGSARPRAVAKRSHIDAIFKISNPYLRQTLDAGSYAQLRERIEPFRGEDRRMIVQEFCQIYRDIIKTNYQSQHPYDAKLQRFIEANSRKVKIIWDDCLSAMKSMKSESIHLMVTSPPYYNARDYSQWENLECYLRDMERIIRESYRVLDNHRAFVFNVGDITGNDNMHTKSTWGSRRIPLGAYFIKMFEDIGFTFIDDIIWDKGEVQSQRHKNGDTPYPLYQYPVNCYEHILIFYKHRKDETRYPCPICGCLKVNGNAYTNVGVKSWECKNLKCFERSQANRGKRFSLRSMVMNDMRESEIPSDYIKQWRRDIVNLSPVIKINSKGENVLGHTAPFPPEIPEFAVRTLTKENEIVLDPFAGSFTSAIVAAELNRIGVGIEMNKEMFGDSIIANIHKHGHKLEEKNGSTAK